MRGTMLLSRAAQIAESHGEPNADILLDLGKAIADKLGDLPAAIARVSCIPAHAPEAPFARGLEGRWRARLGDLAGAALAYARVRELGASLASGSEDPRAQTIAGFLVEGAEMERSRKGDSLAAQRHLAVALRLRPHDPHIREAYREVGEIIARAIPAEPDFGESATQDTRLPLVDLSSESYSVEDAPDAMRVEELTRRLQADPKDDPAAEELIGLLELLGRGHELLALVSARLEDASPDRRAALAPRARAALARLAIEAEGAGRLEEASMYRQAAETL
jgi:cellulose synthase operon protein C